MDRLAVYEPPFVHADRLPSPSFAIDPQIEAAIDCGDLDRAARLFFALTGMTADAVEGMSTAPFWKGLLGRR